VQFFLPISGGDSGAILLLSDVVTDPESSRKGYDSLQPSLALGNMSSPVQQQNKLSMVHARAINLARRFSVQNENDLVQVSERAHLEEIA
jgi:hypothetical protein